MQNNNQSLGETTLALYSLGIACLFNGAKTYKVTLPKGIPEANFWSLFFTKKWRPSEIELVQ